MATNDPRPVVKAGASSPPAPRPAADGGTTKVLGTPLSYEDAELFASRIRPSWELFDDAARDDIAADLAAPSPSSPSSPSKPGPHDTVIEGVPTVAIGAAPVAPPAVAAPAIEEKPSAAAKPGPTLDDDAKPVGGKRTPAMKTQMGVGPSGPSGPTEAPAPPAAKVVTKTASDPDASSKADPAPAKPTPAKVHAKAAAKPAQSKPGPKPVAKAEPSRAEPAKVEPAKVEPAKPVQKADAAVASSRPRVQAPEDDLVVPVTGASRGTLVKGGLAIVALLAVGAIAYGAFGGASSEKSPDKTASTPSSTATARATAVPLPATVPAPPPVQPTTQATAVAPTPSATAVAASAAPAKTADPTPARQAAPPVSPVSPVSKPPATRPATPPPAAKKTGGGIIRETPF